MKLDPVVEDLLRHCEASVASGLDVFVEFSPGESGSQIVRQPPPLPETTTRHWSLCISEPARLQTMSRVRFRRSASRRATTAAGGSCQDTEAGQPGGRRAPAAR
jgi:hypothetical protein